MGNACIPAKARASSPSSPAMYPPSKKLSLFSRHIIAVHESVTDSMGNNKSRTVKVNNLVMVSPKDVKVERRQAERALSREEEPRTAAEGAGGLSQRHKEIIARCWRLHIVEGRRDIFHRTMLQSIEASPKLNEIIACGRYCYRDLTKWPKLNRICQAQFKFYERLIYELNLDEERMRAACTRLGQTHAEYGKYGLKPHFLDIYQQQLLVIVAKLNFAHETEREETVEAFGLFTRFIIDIMIAAYGQRRIERRNVAWRDTSQQEEQQQDGEEKE